MTLTLVTKQFVTLINFIGRRYAINAVCLCICLTVSSITTKSITVKVISRFHWNLVLWLGLKRGRTCQLLVV